MTRFELIPQIPLSEDNAEAVVNLRDQDMRLGAFKVPSGSDVLPGASKVYSRMEQNPQNYSGYQNEEGTLVAYMKTNEWFRSDETPFIENFFDRQYSHAILIANRMAKKSISLEPKAFGVFGLVVDASLEDDDRNEMYFELLKYSADRALEQNAHTVNVPIHDHDPLLPVAQGLGFRRIGRKAVAAGAPGLKQFRYQLDLSKN